MRFSSHSVAPSLLGAALLALAAPLQAQVVDDVVMHGRQYGTVPPAAYFQMLEEDPEAYEFERAWMNRRPDLRAGDDTPLPPGMQRIFGNYDGAVEGNFRFPLVLGYYADDAAAPAFNGATVQSHFLDGANPTGTIRDYFLAASNGKVDLQGETFDWKQSTLTRAEVTGGNSGLGGTARVGEYIVSVLVQLDDGSIDWGRYDNDGPDGIPNSGDDDGYVDVLAVIHPTGSGACSGPGRDNKIWSHRWRISSSTGSSYVTQTPKAGGGTNIRINDYTIQALLNCPESDINTMGTFAHELGHGFGLPDLYATGSSDHSGIGTWGLMGSGNWGCANNNSSRPCMPSAWTREALGWATFQDIGPDTDVSDLIFRSPAEGGTIYRYRVPGSRTYYLLEHRSRVSFDSELREPGLLIWQIDPDAIDAPGGVNANPDAMGVWLRQADGLNNLGDPLNTNRGDTGDPFPGWTGNTAFHAGSTPSSHLIAGPAAALTVLDITSEVGQTRARVVTGRSEVTVRTQGSPGATLQVNGVPYPGEAIDEWAPFETLDLIAEGGTVSAPGTRAGFDGWSDAVPTRARSYSVPMSDAVLTANYGALEYRVETSLTSDIDGVTPGTLSSTPASGEFWFRAGSEVAFTATPEPGFVFEEWSGDLTGTTNPITAQVNAPMSIGASFSSAYQVVGPGVVEVVAGVDTEIQLSTVGGFGATTWTTVSGALPNGLTLPSGSGRIFGFPLETGSFSATIRATDARGVSGEMELQIQVAAPDISISTLAAPLLETAGGPTVGVSIWLDRAGNNNGSYDVGDAVLYLRGGGGSGEVGGRQVQQLMRAIAIGGGR